MTERVEVPVTDAEAIAYWDKVEEIKKTLRIMMTELEYLKSVGEYNKAKFWRRVSEVYGIDVDNEVWEYDRKNQMIIPSKKDDPMAELKKLFGISDEGKEMFK